MKINDILLIGVYWINVGAYSVELVGKLSNCKSFACRFAIIIILVVVGPVRSCIRKARVVNAYGQVIRRVDKDRVKTQ